MSIELIKALLCFGGAIIGVIIINYLMKEEYDEN